LAQLSKIVDLKFHSRLVKKNLSFWVKFTVLLGLEVPFCWSLTDLMFA
jgi:hypothetical protein